ncbi:MAG: pyridoxamine 5'-phosphate oxidase family protein, partial [Cyclobacteriaceae bacterium]|nr:pyridoxamine 5'-phosphate oxidase family protein [Cyclobacteriaceae bacterium]
IYDLQTAYDILDDAFICHVGVVKEGIPVVIPMLYGRSGDQIYIHGATKSSLLELLSAGSVCSLTVTHIDALVLARSAFHHSANYRSVVLFGTMELVDDVIEKEKALAVISDQIIPGRWSEARLPNKKELKGTSVLKFKIEEGSSKIRTGGPSDDKEDYNLDIWAGIIPLKLKAEEAIPDPLMHKKIDQPESVKNYLKNKK